MFKCFILLVCFMVVILTCNVNGMPEYRRFILDARPFPYSFEYTNVSVDLTVAKELGITRKKRGCRRGNTSVAIGFTNCHGRETMLLNPGSTYLKKYSFTFLCETMVTEKKFKPCNFPGKTNFVHHARITSASGLGRPSGGHEWYANSHYKPRFISSSDHHMTMAFHDYTLIGCYFRPGLDLDIITNILTTEINHVSNSDRVIIGGDFNLHTESEGFKEINSLLEKRGLQLTSNPDIPSFFHPKGTSTVDYIYSSSKLKVKRAETRDLSISDHATMGIVIKVPINLSSSPLHQDKRRRLNIEECAKDLDNLNVHEAYNEAIDIDNNASQIVAAIEKNSTLQPVKTKGKTKEKEWFSSELHDLRDEMLDQLRKFRLTGDSHDAGVYSLLRGAYHRALREAERLHDIMMADSFIERSKSTGISALYGLFRKSSPASTVDPTTFRDYCLELFKPFQTQVFPHIPFCDPSHHELSADFSTNEIFNIINKFKSKATTTIGISPLTIKQLSNSITPKITPLLNSCLKSCKFPLQWLESTVFFIHKKGDTSNPSNFRSIAIQNPFLKILTSSIARRISTYAENHNLFPYFQFGFRKAHSTIAAATVLFEAVNSRLNCKPKSQKTYVCFVDFAKCFDSIHRDLLFVKLQRLGVPPSLCLLLHFIYANTKFYIRSGVHLVESFESSIGLPQGCCLSPILFCLFVADLPNCLPHAGVLCGTIFLKYLQFADDLALIADSASELQAAIDALSSYCVENRLTINVDKTKVLVFHKGRIQQHSFYLHGKEIEQVTSFTYLGFTFTTQLSFSQHAESLNQKASSKCGLLFSNLTNTNLPLHVILELFNCYILPTYRYGLTLCMAWKNI